MPTVPAQVHLDPGALAAQMATDVRAGLTSRPKTLPPKYFYDARGSRAVRRDHAAAGVLPDPRRALDPGSPVDEIAELTSAETLIELGSGTSEKTRLLLRR